MHELPLLILRCSCKDRLALRCGWRSEARNVARCCRLPERLCWRARAAASALHMGYPLNAFNALRHVSSSAEP